MKKINKIPLHTYKNHKQKLQLKFKNHSINCWQRCEAARALIQTLLIKFRHFQEKKTNMQRKSTRSEDMLSERNPLCTLLCVQVCHW